MRITFKSWWKEEHGQELTTDELMDLYHQQQQEVMEVISPLQEEKKAEDSLTPYAIMEKYKRQETVQILW